MSNPSVWPEVGPATPASLLRSRAAERGEKTAFVFLADGEVEAGRLTYAGLDGRARTVASALRESLAPGDRALLLSPPGLEFIVAFFGCLYAGVIAVPAYPPRFRDKPGGRSQERLSAIVRDAEPRAALTTASILAAFSETSSVPELAAMRWIATDVLEGLEGSHAEIPEPDPESVAFLQYTSGSTSEPKGVMVTHANLLHNERMIGEAFRQDESSVVVGWLPLYHDMGLIGNVLQPLHAGGSCVLMAPVAFLQKPLRWLQAIDRFRGTTSGGPNFAYELCLRKIGEEEQAGLDLSSWRLAYNGAEPVRAETLERFAEAFAPCGFRPEAFFPCYGLAEATLFVSGGAAGRIPRVARVDAAALERNEARPAAGEAEVRRLVSCGRAWAGQRIAVVDPESGEELPAGRIGEIWVAGPSVARGYWRNPEATACDFQACLASLPPPPWGEGRGEEDGIDPEGPFLRTGDLGFLRDGELYVTGRIKDLIIIRGRNHYPQDVELTAERSHSDLRPGSGAAFSVEVGGEERLVLVQEVERRRREGFEEMAEAMRRAVAEEHEVQVHEVVLVRVGAVPKTSSGKIQRRACRSLYLAGELAVVGRSVVAAEVPGAADVTAALSRASLASLKPAERWAVVERFLRERAAAALGVRPEGIDPERPLTGLGLDSLSAVELKAAVESALGVPLPLADLLEGAGTGALATVLLSALAGEAGPAGPPLRAGGAELDLQPLSFGQKALWFIDRLAPEGGAYNVAVAARARGLDPAALRRALRALALRHPALRSVFPVVAGEPMRRVLDRPEVDFAVEAASGWTEARLAERLADEAYRPFDLVRGPLLRVRAFDRGKGEHALLLSVHHIAVDFASLAVMARDLSALYQEETGGAPAELEPLVSGVSDFVRWQDEMLAGPRGDRLWEHWREALAGLPDLDLPADRPRPPVQTWRGGARTLELALDLADGIRALAAGQGTTLFTALLAVFQAQLARHTGQEDFAVGSPSAGRPPELAGAVGYFVNPVALRADLSGDPSFAVLLDRVRRTVLAGLEHGDFPFALLAERLRPARDPARTPLFQVMFSLQRARPGDAPGIATFALGEAGGKLTLGGMELESLRLEERRAQFDLALRMAEEAGGRVRASLEFNAALFDAATAERMLGHFRTLLAGALAVPAARLSDLPLLTAGERAGLLASGRTEGAAAEPVLIHELFAERARLAPDAVALAADGEVLSYAELSARAEALAQRLRDLGVGPEVRVAVALERSPELIVALLGVLAAGGAWLPIDPAYPQERIDLLFADSGARVLLRGDLTPRPTSPPSGVRSTSRPEPRNLAYVLYTSGSTGRPKGVAVDHAAAAAHFRTVIEVYGFGPGERILFFASPSFDVALEQVLPGLLTGATIVLRGRDLWEPADLARRIEELGLTFINLPTAYWSRWVREAEELAAAPASLRSVLVGGEEMPAESVRRWRLSVLSGIRLLNGYGPTETVVTATLHDLGGDGPGPVSIGRPLPGRSAHVVDRHGGLLPAGARGELALGGVLARGYLGAPDRTAERFIPDPFWDQTDRTDRTDRSDPGGRLYRTGDLVRRRADGNLEFLGRIDTQLKVRGFRVEAGEVEAALLEHPGVREAAVLLHGEALAAWLVLDPESGLHSPRSFRAFLSGKLPAWMIPASYTLLSALPLTPHGKIDRQALPRPAGAGAEDGWTAPRNALEEALAAVWAQVLGVERVGAHDDFFHLGGHSLLATQLVARVRAVLGVELPLTALFQAPTVAALAERIVETAPNEWTTAVAPPVFPVLRPHEGRADLPLSFAQQRLWFLDRLRPGGAAYNMPGAAELAGALDTAVLSSALSEIVRRHEALRTRVVDQGGRPVQVIDPPRPAGLEIVDLTGLPDAVLEAEAAAQMGTEAARPFDLSRGPLLRAILLRLAPERHRLLLTLHHVVADGRSLDVLLAELAALYGAFAAGRPSPLAELPVQYADFVVWQRDRLAGAALERQLAWWRDQLAGAPSTLTLPADRPRPAERTERGAVVRTALPAALAYGVRTLARRCDTTPFTTLLATFQTLLLRVSGQEDLLVGSAVAGRTRPEIEGLIGFFANTLVLRGALAGDPTFLAALKQARQRTIGAWEHQDLPVERLVEELQPGREPGLSPLFQVVFVLQGAPAELELPGLAVRRLQGARGTAKFDLTLELTEQEDGLAATWELSRDLFEETTIERLAGWFGSLLEGAVEAPERRLSELPLLGEAELRQLLVEQNPAPTAAPLEMPVHRLFEEQAARGPERVALVQDDMELTYAELNARANQLARHLLKLGAGPETLVGVLLERSSAMIEAFLAVLKAGGAYVPLDPAWPRERLADLIDDAGIRLVLTRDRFPDREALAGYSAENLPAPDHPDLSGRLAYAMFTSGSTGRPKAVGVEHRSIVRLVRGAGFADFGPDHVFLQLAPPAFDAATLEIWGALLHGARLALAPPAAPSLDELGEILARHGVTTLWLTAGLFHQVVESRIGILRGVRQLLAGGDVLSPAAVNRVLAELPKILLINGYGPTENTTFTCCHTVTEPVPPGRIVPIGRPIAGTRVYVVDRWLRPVPALVPGELLAGGEGLARGYLGRPDLTAERFVPSPFTEEGARLYRTGDLVRWLPSGAIEFLGRLDRQVKIRGFRVEPGEIEAVLTSHPAVAQAAVLVREPEPGDRRLVACIVSAGGGELPLAELRAWLAERLPAHLIPVLVALPELPLTANGKVDRQALERVEPSPGTPEQVALDAPRTPVEELIAGIWAEILGVERVGVHDDFFQLGGHSLIATRVVSRLVDTLGVELPLATFFEARTVAGLAERLGGAGSRPEAPPLVPVARDEPLPLSFAQQRLWLLDRLAPGGSAYNVAVAALLTGELDVAALQRSLGEIVRRHEALRTVFAEIDGQPVQIVQPWEPPVLVRRELPDLEVAREEAARDAARPFDLSTGPVVRFALTALGPPFEIRKHLLAATFHHIAADGWSLQVFLRELAELYGAFAAGRPPELAEPSVQYTDYAVWQRQAFSDEVLARPLAFWRQRLAGLEPLELPADGPRTPAATVPARTRPLDLPAALAARVAACAREAGATPFMVVLAGVYALLARWTGQRDLTVGAPVAARHRLEIDGLIGFFANTLVLRMDLGELEEDPPFQEMAARVRTVVLEAHAHGDVPFERLVEELQPDRAPGRNPLFDVLLAWLSAPAGQTGLPGLALAPVELPGAEAKFDLTFTVHERGGVLSGTVEGRGDLFEEATLGRLAEHLRILLAGALSDLAAPLSGLPLLSEAELWQLTGEWNDTAADLADTRERDLCLHDLVAVQAARTPDAPAVLAEDARWTYRELDEEAERLARALQRLGVRPETRVGLFLERSAALVAAILGVWKAGGVYVPLDPAYPPERLAFQLADSGAAVLVTEERLADRAPGGSCRRLLLGGPDAAARDRPGSALRRSFACEPSADLLAGILYTSGSTGRPKGVMLHHRGLVNRLLWAQETYRLSAADTVLLKASFGFDFSIWESFAPLIAGARLVVAPPGKHQDTAWILRAIADHRVTAVHFVPSLLSAFLREEGIEDGCASVRQVFSGGEALSPELRDRCLERIAAPLDNQYGPTEISIDTTRQVCAPWRRTTGEPARVPLGRPIANARIVLLDRRWQPVPIGVAGELCVGGPGVTRGYLGRPDLTAERFIPDPFAEGGRSDQPGGRLYRTGDLARRLPDGNLEFLGRADQQVKVRGVRIEPGEIEAALDRLPEVAAAAVAADPGGMRLVAYVVTRGGKPLPAASALREALGRSLPEVMIPSLFIRLEALPTTPSGKLDRRALPRPRIEAGGDDQAAPRSPVEEMLAGVWKELLGVEPGPRDGFFDLGGHSLTATQLVSRVRQVLGVEIPVAAVFEAPVLRDLAARLEEALRGALQEPPPSLARRPEGEAAPLSYAQQRLWFLNQLEPESAAYNVPGALRLSGPLRVEALAGALAGIVRRHEVLRTVFRDSGGAPVQIVLPPGGPGLPVVDLAGLPAAVREAEGLARIGEEAARPFDLERGGPLRVALLRLAAEGHLLSVVMHHIASDAWSLRILLRELPVLYAAVLEGEPSPLPELPVQYADFALWQRRWLAGDVLERELEPWRRTLAGAPSSLALPTDRPRPAAPTWRGGRRPFRLGAAETAALQDLARRGGWTFFMLLLAAFQALLSRLSGQEDVVVGSPIANRTRLEIEGLIGFFTNTLALRLDLSGDPPFWELGRRARSAALESYTHQDLPFEKLVEDLAPERHLGRNPLFQTLLVVQREPELPRLPGLGSHLLDADPGIARFDLTLMLIEEAGGMTGFLEHSRDLFDAVTVDRMLGHFRTLLAGVTTDPGLRLSELPLLTAAEQDELLAWGRAPGPRVRPECVHERVAAQAARTPEATAVELGRERLTYRELVARARGLAHRLAALGVGPDVAVGIFLERSIHQMVAVLAVLEAGGAYLPLDPGYPAERLRLMIEDARAPVILTRTSLAGALPPGAGRPLLLDGAEASWSTSMTGGELPAVASGVTPDHLVYLIYTSGSTGRPKGVAMTHGAISAMLHWQVRASAVPAGRTLQSTTLSFDVSFQEIFSTWWAGGTLVLVSEEVRRDPAALLAWLDAQRVERLFLPFVALQQLAVAATAGLPLPGERVGEREIGSSPGSLREVLSAGEQLFVTPQVAALLARCPGAVLQNHYGPTETHAVTWLALEGDPAGWPERPAVGRPLDHADVRLLDPGLRPVPIGVAGEVCAGGAGLARGYLGRPDLTAERFVPDPFAGAPGSRMYRTGDLARLRPDGLLEYLGRGDSQVKVRGHRIELHEVEAALVRHPAVAQAAVAVRGEGAGAKRLAAYVVLRGDGPAPTPAGLRSFLAETLPDPMIPSAWARVESLPRTPSGKLDRRALARREPDEGWGGDGARVAPRTPTEELLADLWRQVLGIERVGAHDDFFELGGHSLLATQVASRLRATFQVDLPLRRLFEATTLAALAAAVDAAAREAGAREAGAGQGTAVPPIRPVPRGEEGLPLSFAQERLWFLDRLQPGGAAYNVPLVLRAHGDLQVAALAAALSGIVRRHEVLRTIFAERDGVPVQIVLPAAPVPLPVIDLRALPAAVREREARRLAVTEGGRPFDLARGPLLRAGLLALAPGEHLLLLNLHHIAADGWSLGVLVREVRALYGAAAALPALPVQYADFASWQREWLAGGVLERQLAWWRAELSGCSGVLELPTDRPRPPVLSGRGAVHRFSLDGELLRRIASLGRAEGATPFMVLAAGLFALLSRITGQSDVVLGSPVANRNRIETESLIGCFVNTLVLRAGVSRSASFGSLLRQVRERSLGAYAHQDLPFERLVDEVRSNRDLSRSPLFQVALALQNAPLPAADLDGVALVPEDIPSDIAKFDLALVFVEAGGGLSGVLQYATDLFTAPAAARFARHLENLLATLVAQPGARLGEVPLLAAEERHQVLHEWNDTRRPLAEDPRIEQLFERRVKEQPDAPAVEHEGVVLTYRELDEKASRLATLLRDLGVGPGRTVGVWMERSLHMVTSVLAVLKAGGTYVPLLASWPAGRVEAILAAQETRVLLTAGHLQGTAQDLWWRRPLAGLLSDVVCLDVADPEPPSEPLDADSVRGLWDMVSARAVDRVTAAGFISSFTGLPFTEAEVDEYRDRVLGLATPWLGPGRRVLEIGCGAGLLLWEMAQRAELCVGLDPSERTQERNREHAREHGIGNVELRTGFAHETGGLPSGSFDLVVLASTIQFFPGPLYLERVIRESLRLLAPGGALLLADVMDARRREELRQALAAAGAPGRPGAGGELAVDEDFFRDLGGALPAAEAALVLHRREGFANELGYRYDVVIRRGEERSSGPMERIERRKRLWTGWHVEGRPAARVPAAGTPDDLAYVIHTSGSTGEPKGIAVQHRPVASLIAWVNGSLGVGPGDRLLFVTSLCFDLSVWDVFGTLAAGGTVLIASEAELRDPERLARRLRQDGVTIWDSAPAALQQLVPFFPDRGCDSPLRLVMLSGDWIPVRLPDQVRAGFPAARMISLGGATETAVWSNVYPVDAVDPAWPSIPYGRPIDNARYHILDESLGPCPIGVAGDLYIGGDCLSVGYAGRPRQTAAQFLPDPFSGAPGSRLYRTGDRARLWQDGVIELLGRVDQQVKIRGFRIEPGEIENALQRHPGVRDAVATAREDVAGEKRLVAYVVPARQPAPEPAELRAFLQTSLPDYMVPWSFVILDALPVTANGKLDRAALPAPRESRAAATAHVAPRNDLERAIGAVWCEVLELDRVGVQESFFEAGGSSLLMARLHSRLRQTLGRDFPFMDLFRHPTIEGLARSLGGEQVETRTAQARARTETRREAMQQLQQRRGQRQRRPGAPDE